MLCHNSSLQKLDLSSNPVTSSALLRLASALSQNITLQSLGLAQCDLLNGGSFKVSKSHGLDSLVTALGTNVVVKSLDLSGNFSKSFEPYQLGKIKQLLLRNDR